MDVDMNAIDISNHFSVSMNFVSFCQQFGFKKSMYCWVLIEWGIFHKWDNTKLHIMQFTHAKKNACVP